LNFSIIFGKVDII